MEQHVKTMIKRLEFIFWFVWARSALCRRYRQSVFWDVDYFLSRYRGYLKGELRAVLRRDGNREARKRDSRNLDAAYTCLLTFFPPFALVRDSEGTQDECLTIRAKFSSWILFFDKVSLIYIVW